MRVSSTTVDAESLRTLADKANREHRQAASAAGQAIGHAVEAGKLLQKAKEALPHGKFIPWVEQNFAGTPRHARRYMKLAKSAAENRIDPDEVSSIREAERLLREQDAEQAPDEYEPEVQGEEYMRFPFDGGPQPDEADKGREPGVPADKGATEPSKRAGREPARKPDLATSAFNAMGRFIHEVSGEEKDRIQAIRERLDMEESTLLVLASQEGRRS